MSWFRISQVSHWLEKRHAQVLNSAYQAAQEIRSLENQYCGGQPITDPSVMGQTVYSYVRSLCDRKLLTIRNNLAQLKVNSFLLGRPVSEVAPIGSSHLEPQIDETGSGNTKPSTAEVKAAASDEVITKLKFIESVLSRYRDPHIQNVYVPESTSQVAPQSPQPNEAVTLAAEDVSMDQAEASVAAQSTDPALAQLEVAAADLARPGLLGSFSMNRKKIEQYEKQVILELRQWRQQSRAALRWIAILLIVPILTTVLSKHLLFGPLLGNYSNTNPTAVQLSEEIQAEFAAHLTAFKEELEIRELLNLSPELSPQVKREQLAEKASELWREARNQELNGLKNVLSDSVGTLTFIGLVYFNRRRLTVVRTFVHRVFLSLSNPIKVLLFILVTDMFVGFHSAEGWDAILTWLTHHFGLPEQPIAINLFIATVPVMMDSFIKFWIFNYLTRFSPSSSAIYERMNT